MKIGIMQPYFFPYIGYWQLINLVDKYVIYDDVNYIKGGWINRNRILVNGQAAFFNLRLSKASSNKLINQIEVLNNPVYNKKLLKTIEFSYSKAPFFLDVFPIIDSIINCEERGLASYLEHLIREICNYLSITTSIILSSQIPKDNSLKGQEKVLEICKILNASEYINAIGGRDLYSIDEFAHKGIKLRFLKTNEIVYRQFNHEFIPNLSIIDVLMFNSKDEVKRMLLDYCLI